MADKRIFDLTTIKTVEDFDENTWIWMDKQAPEGEPALPSWKVRGDLFLKVLNNFATHFVPNVLTVVGKCYWHGGELFVCDTAYTGDWVPGNFSLTSIDALFSRKDVQEAIQSSVSELQTKTTNISASIAPEFDPTKPNDAGGYAYYAGEIVSNNGATYRFKVNHPSGAWNPAEVDRYVASESLKFFVVTNSPEYLYAITDENDRFLFGVRKDGTFVVAKYSDLIDGLASKVDKETGKSLVDDSWANSLVDETNGEYKYAVVDVNDKLLFGIKESGEFYFAMSSEKVDDDWIKALLSSDNEEYSKVTTDNRNRLLDAVRKNGLHEFFTKMKFSGGVDWTSENMAELSNALKAYGILGGTGDWSDAKSLQIPKPKLAIINITNITTMPTTKTADAKAIMQFWDLNGNYFKKKVIMNAQGNSTLVWPKKNAAFDICNDDWVGDDTFKLKIGDWVEQDSFHLKAGYNDFLRSGVGEVCYDFYKQILDTRNVNENRSWKLALLNEINTRWAGRGYGITESVKDRSDCGALCFPQGFPCVVYLNDEFYGVFAFQLKKHRDNYMMDKSTKTNIHLDGRLGSAFFTGSINWTDFEVRNPKNLYTMDGNKYDGDDPKELIDPTSASYDPNNSKHVNTYFVKQKIIALSQVYSRVSAEQTDAGKKAIVESVFNIDNLVDYQIFCDVTYSYDGFEKNWQWTTWDGEHWFVNAYDLDGCFGAYFQGTALFSPHSAKMGNVNGLPTKYVLDFYNSVLDERYAELRQAKVIDTDNIVSMLLGWDNAISKFKKVEFDKWPGASCNKDIVVDSHWEIVEDGGSPAISYSPFTDYYNPDTAYSVGSVVSYNYTNGFGWAYKLRCVESSVGNTPITEFGFKDSVWRLKTWLEENLANMDIAYSFN